MIVKDFVIISLNRVTYDFESVDDGCVTVRDRDTMAQERVAIDKLNEYIAEKIKF